MDLKRLHLDQTLFFALLALAAISIVIVYSATGKDLQQTSAHVIRLGVGFAVMFAVAQVRPENIERWAPYLYAAGMILLIVVLGVGVISKGAQRWLNLGLLRFQPAEVMKLAVPMMIAWFYARGALPPTYGRLAVGFAIAAAPALFIFKQPDLGTAVLVFSAGLMVLFLAGMHTRVIVAGLVAFVAALPILWSQMHEYQRDRVLTLIDPSADPLGSGYHTIQSMIAIGSGGFYGKGWLNSSQAHLEYLPESATDFVFAVFAEEFGLIGILLGLGLYLFITLRCLLIAFHAQDTFMRLVAGGVALTFFIQFFVNIGMVSGILPVVGVPLPMMSYGGSAVLIMMAGFGVLMSFQTHRKIVEY